MRFPIGYMFGSVDRSRAGLPMKRLLIVILMLVLAISFLKGNSDTSGPRIRCPLCGWSPWQSALNC